MFILSFVLSWYVNVFFHIEYYIIIKYSIEICMFSVVIEKMYIQKLQIISIVGSRNAMLYESFKMIYFRL